MVGFGYSDRPEGVEYSLDTWADQTLGVMDALGIEKAHLVGNSFGGGIALRLATQHPDRVDKLVLMGSMGVAFEITEGLDTVWGYDGTLEDMKKVMGYFAYDRVADQRRPGPGPLRGRNPARLPGVVLVDVPGPPAALGGVDDGAGDEISALPHRTLIVHGREDQVIPLETSLQARCELLDNADLSVFSHCGHWSMIERRDDFNRQVRDFFLGQQYEKRTRGRHDGSKDQQEGLGRARSRAATPSCCAASTRSWCSPGPSRTAWWPCTGAATCSARSTPATGTRRSGRGGLVPAARRLHGADPPRPRRAPVARHGALAGDGELHGQGHLADRRPGRHPALRPARPGHLQPAQPHPGQLPGGHRDGLRREVPRRGQGVPGVLRRRVDLAGGLPRVADDRRACRTCRTCSSSRTTSTPTPRRCG